MDAEARCRARPVHPESIQQGSSAHRSRRRQSPPAIRDGGKVLLFRARLAKAPPIIRDRLVACADGVQLRAPHAAVADRGVQSPSPTTFTASLAWPDAI